MEEENNDHRLVRKSVCKVCKLLVTAMALEMVDSKSLKNFEKEVAKYDLEVVTLTLGEFNNEEEKDFCNCD